MLKRHQQHACNNRYPRIFTLLWALLYTGFAIPVSVSAQQPQSNKQTTIHVSLLTNFHDDWRVFKGLFSEFEQQYPQLKIELHAREDSRQRRLKQKLEVPEDLAFVQLNNSHCHGFAQGRYGAINPQWRALALNQAFSDGIKQVVSCDDNIIALPAGFYTWGFFYHKTFFDVNDLQEPASWQEFIQLLQTIKRITGQPPINLGSKGFWATAAWFDYLNLRLNGSEFHRQTLAGEVPFTHQRLVSVFQHWRQLVSANMFLHNHQELSWDDAYGFFLRGQTQLILGSTNLSGSFKTLARKRKLGFFPFPEIAPQVERAENIPLDGFVFSPEFLKQPFANAMIAFLSSPTVQQALAEQLNYYPANLQATVATTPLDIKIHSGIRQSSHFMRFFDRDTDPKFAHQATRVFRRFMLEKDVNNATQQLEDYRLMHFSN